MLGSWADLAEQEEQQKGGPELVTQPVDIHVAEFPTTRATISITCSVTSMEFTHVTLTGKPLASRLCVKFSEPVPSDIIEECDPALITFENQGTCAVMPARYVRRSYKGEELWQGVRRQPSLINSYITLTQKATQVCVCRVVDYFFIEQGEERFVVKPLRAWNTADVALEMHPLQHFERTLETLNLYVDEYQGSLPDAEELRVVRQYDAVCFCNSEETLLQSAQAVFRDTLIRVVAYPLDPLQEKGTGEWVRTRVQKYVTRHDHYDYGFTRDNQYMIRSNYRIRLYDQLDRRFLTWKNVGGRRPTDPDWEDAHEQAIIFGYVPVPLKEEQKVDGRKELLRFFTAKSVDGFDSLFTFLRTKGRHRLFQGRTLKDIIAMCKARTVTYDEENRWWRFSEDRTEPTVWSGLMQAYFSLSNSLHVPAVIQFMRLYMPIHYAALTQPQK